MQPAFRFVGSGPATGAPVLEVGYGPSRRAAADGEISLAEQGMDRELALGFVVGDVFMGPRGDGVDFHEPLCLVPLHDRGGEALSRCRPV